MCFSVHTHAFFFRSRIYITIPLSPFAIRLYLALYCFCFIILQSPRIAFSTSLLFRTCLRRAFSRAHVADGRHFARSPNLLRIPRRVLAFSSKRIYVRMRVRETRVC